MQESVIIGSCHQLLILTEDILYSRTVLVRCHWKLLDIREIETFKFEKLQWIMAQSHDILTSQSC